MLMEIRHVVDRKFEDPANDRREITLDANPDPDNNRNLHGTVQLNGPTSELPTGSDEWAPGDLVEVNFTKTT